MGAGGGYGVEMNPRKEKAVWVPKPWPERGAREAASANPILHPELCQGHRASSVTQMFQMMGSGFPRLGSTPGIPAGRRAHPEPGCEGRVGKDTRDRGWHGHSVPLGTNQRVLPRLCP